MAWVRIEDGTPLHTKFYGAGVAAYGWWIAALAYCNRELTDGFIPARALDLVFLGHPHETTMDLVEVLVRERLLHPVAEGQQPSCSHRGCPRALARTNGYILHDYFDYQPRRFAVLARRRMRSKAGRQGGVQSALSRKQLATPLSKHGASSVTNPVPTRPDPSRPVSIETALELHAPDGGVDSIIDEIVTATRDAASTPYYRGLVAELGADRVRSILSETRQALAEGKVTKTPARYFTDLAQRYRGRKPFGAKGR